MKRLASACLLFRAPGLIVIALGSVLLGPATATAVDGVPLSPPGSGAYDMRSMEAPEMSGPMLAFEVYQLSGNPAAKSQTARIHLWNAATGLSRAIGLDGMPPAGADQRHPTIFDSLGNVSVVWEQQNSPGASRDLWLWRGTENGQPLAGYPRLLVSGPAGSNQRTPRLDVAEAVQKVHLVLAWADDRDSAGASALIYALDLSADGDGDTVPDYLEAGYDPTNAGRRLDFSGGALAGQHDPAVGRKGVFWLDDRGAAGSGESDVYRANLAAVTPLVTVFWHNAIFMPVDGTRATGEGAAWLGPGIAGGPFQPWAKRADAVKAGIVTSLANPGVFDVDNARYALTGGHGGNTDTDPDIFFYDQATGQNVPVCSVGGPFWNRLRVQTTPTISTAPGGSRIVWADSRQRTNTAATDRDALAYQLYVGLVPTVSLSTDKVTVKRGKPLTLSTTVAPAFRGYGVKFQKGTSNKFPHPYYAGGASIWYTDWTTLKTKALSSSSSASWQWKPTQRGVYWVRAWFVGGKKYTDGGSRKVPHVPNTSRVIKIVVQ